MEHAYCFLNIESDARNKEVTQTDDTVYCSFSEN